MRVSISFACLCLLIVGTQVFAQDQKRTMDPQAMMETYRKLATPGEQHKRLAKLEGTWTTHTTSYMEPGNPPKQSTGICQMHMLLEGRFLQQECTGEMMGHPFTSIEVTGYDNYTKQYVTTWKSTMDTGLFVMQGTGSVDGKTITLKGNHRDPYEGVMKHRAVWRIPDSNTQTFEMYHLGKGGKDMLDMEIRYERKQ